MQGNKPREGRPLVQGHPACNGRARAGTQVSELPGFLQALGDHVIWGLELPLSHYPTAHHIPAMSNPAHVDRGLASCPSAMRASLPVLEPSLFNWPVAHAFYSVLTCLFSPVDL